MSEIIPTIALSFSRLSDYETCPLKFKAKYITKDYPDESNNPAFEKGNAIHKQLEDYINYKKSSEAAPPPMGSVATNLVPMIDRLHKTCDGNIFGEKQIAINQNWEKCDWFASPSVVKYRAIIDMLAFVNGRTLIVNDFKSGKVRDYEDGPTTQLKLTAAMMFSLYPNIEEIHTNYLFVEHKKTVSVPFKREQLEDLKAPFNKAYDKVQMEKEFSFKKNKYCNWCLYQDCPIKK